MPFCLKEKLFILVAMSLVLLKIHRRQMVRMREDEIRIFLQELNRRHFDDDVIITELESVHSELVKSRLATPPLIVELQDISQLNCEALERVRSNPPSPDASIPTHSDIHVLSNGLTPYNNGHHAIGPVRKL